MVNAKWVRRTHPPRPAVRNNGMRIQKAMGAKRSPGTREFFCRLGLGFVIFAFGWPTPGSAGECDATSGGRRVPVLELYTSEGCDSCPPVDRWVGGLPARGLTPDRVVTLAFHVDYWNHLGWADPYARAEFSERQRAATRRNEGRFVYTPQLMLNGKDYRRGILSDDFKERVEAINRERPS